MRSWCASWAWTSGTEPVARVGGACHHGGVTDAEVWDLLDRLDAAADFAEQLHPDICPVWRGDACSCGVPSLVGDAAAFIRSHVVEATVRQAQQAA